MTTTRGRAPGPTPAWVAGALLVLATSCGGSATPTATPSPTETDQADSEGGFGAPAADDAAFDGFSGTAMTVTAELDDNGCWYAAANGSAAVLIAPAGTLLGEDGRSLVTADELVIEHGVTLDAAGSILALAELPGGADGRWGNYVSFCDPTHGYAVVTHSVDRAFDPAAVDPLVLADQLDTALFDTDHGCGYGFATGDREGRWALHIDTTTATPPEEGTVTLPDDRFEVTVSAGAHLFVNHCDDTFEWFEPTASRPVTWEVTAGSFIYPSTSGEGCVGDPPVTTTLVGATVQTPSGPVALDDIEITNTGFGCFAG